MSATRLFTSITRRRVIVLLLAVSYLIPLFVGSPVAGAVARAPAKKEKSKDDQPPKPQPIVLEAADGVELAMTYYPGTKGKQTVPVVLLHMWKQNRNDYKDLALSLQAAGYAAIVPDLRGHGESTRRRGSSRDDTLKAASLTPGQFAAMVSQDMRAVKRFLWDRNNAGDLNIDKLCIVGAEMGAAVALNFAKQDAMEQNNNRVFGADREYKLGRFVKAMVLLSPKNSAPGLPVWAAVANPVVQRDIAMLILVGNQDPRALEDAKRMNGAFQKFHLDPIGEDKLERQTLFFGTFPTSLQGTKLLDPKFKVPALMVEFISRRLVNSDESKDWVWRERKLRD